MGEFPPDVLDMFFGEQIRYSNNAVEYIDEVRTWKERLFSFPWRPLQKTKKVAKPTIYKIGSFFLVHPVFKREISEIFNGGN